MVKSIVMLSLPDVSLRQEMLPSWLQPLVTTLENLVASPPLIKGLFLFVRQPKIIRRWAGIAYQDLKAINEELVNILAAPAQDEGAANTFNALFKAVRQPEFAPPAKEVLPRLNIPMLLIWGSNDRMVPPNLAPLFAKLNPQIKLIILEAVGHCPHDECPDKFNQILLDWLKTIE
jgi:pimeloyl-ACP methyl ester carboxylesterase